ncbi:MAG: hypothetical protein QG575_2144, partial [Euryarchaeota archaeon]|nr:hypothetical protein [Euryarchaeota archaeon]
CETPVLAFDTPGVNEVAENGGMVYNSMQEMCDLILELHENELKRACLGNKGRRAVEEKFSWKRALDCMEAIYQEVA